MTDVTLDDLKNDIKDYRGQNKTLILILSGLFICISLIVIIYLLNRYYLDFAKTKLICRDKYYKAGNGLKATDIYTFTIGPELDTLFTASNATTPKATQQLPYNNTSDVTIDYYYTEITDLPAAITDSLHFDGIGISVRNAGASIYYTSAPSARDIINSSLLTLDQINISETIADVTSTRLFKSYLLEYPIINTKNDGFHYISKYVKAGISGSSLFIAEYRSTGSDPVLLGSQISLYTTLRKQRNKCQEYPQDHCTVNDPSIYSTNHYCADMIYNNAENIYCPLHNPGCSITDTDASRICYPGMPPFAPSSDTKPYVKWGNNSGYYHMSNSSAAAISTASSEPFASTYVIGAAVDGSKLKRGASVASRYSTNDMSGAPILETHALGGLGKTTGLISGGNILNPGGTNITGTLPSDANASTFTVVTNNPWKNNNKAILSPDKNMNLPDLGASIPAQTTPNNTLNNGLITLGVNN